MTNWSKILHICHNAGEMYNVWPYRLNKYFRTPIKKRKIGTPLTMFRDIRLYYSLWYDCMQKVLCGVWFTSRLSSITFSHMMGYDPMKFEGIVSPTGTMPDDWHCSGGWYDRQGSSGRQLQKCQVWSEEQLLWTLCNINVTMLTIIKMVRFWKVGLSGFSDNMARCCVYLTGI